MAGPWTNFKVDVYRPNGIFLTSTSTVIFTQSQNELDTIGSCKLQIPLNETPLLSLFSRNRICVVSVEHSGSSDSIIIAQFLIHNVTESISNTGVDVLEVSGPDLLYEFTHETLGNTVISDGAGGPSTDALQDVLDIHSATSIADWAYSSFGSGSDNAYIVGSGESVWDAILTITKANNGHVSLGHRIGGIHTEVFPYRNLQFWWGHTFTGGGVLAMDELELDNNQLHMFGRPILDFKRERETTDVVTRVYVYGAGMGDDKFTIADRTAASDPMGFTSYPSNSLVVNNDLEGVIDQPTISRLLNISNIKPEDPDNATERESAANLLVNGAVKYLQEHDGTTRTYYRIKTTVRNHHTVGQLVHLKHTHVSYIDALGDPSATPTEIISVDDDFILIKYDLSYGEDGILYANLLLGEVPKAKTDGQRMVAEKIKGLQMAINNANATPIGSTAPVGVNPLEADGSVSLAGDMQVNAGVRIDNTDISELKISDFVLMASGAEANRGRVLTGGDGMNVVDGGAGGNVTLALLLKALSGLTIDAGQLTLGNPSPLSVATANDVTATSHTHSVVANSAPGASEALIKTDGSGKVTLHDFEATTIKATTDLIIKDITTGTYYKLFLDNGKLRFLPE